MSQTIIPRTMLVGALALAPQLNRCSLPEPPSAQDPGDSTGGQGGGLGTSVSSGHIKTVFVILMENHNWDEILGSPDAPYMNGTILPMASHAENYHGNMHPSEPNYIWLEAGDSLGITTDLSPIFNHRSTTEHLATQLGEAGISWRSYQEDIPGDSCPLVSVAGYRPKHNPFVYFDDLTGNRNPNDRGCIAHNRPLTELTADLASGQVARYNFLTPNMCHDMHDSCAPLDNPVRQGDDWLALWIPRIMASEAYRDGGAIFITWDESETSIECSRNDCPIGMVVLSPLAKGNGYENTIEYDHSSALRTFQEIFGVGPLLRNAANATSLSDLFNEYP